MNDKQLGVFLTAAECGSFSKAESSLFLSRQAIMKQIDRLEQELGFCLFTRTPVGLELTPSGAQFREGILPILRQTEALISACRESSAPRHICIEIPRHPTTLLDSSIRRFKELYPDVSVEIRQTRIQGRTQRIRSGQADISELPHRIELDFTDLDFIHIVDRPFFCLVTPSSPLAGRERIFPADLVGLPVYISDFSIWHSLIEYLNNETGGLDIHEAHPEEIETVLNTCYNGGVYISAAIFASQMNQLHSIPLIVPFTQDTGLVFRKNPGDTVRRFISVALKELKALYP